MSDGGGTWGEPISRLINDSSVGTYRHDRHVSFPLTRFARSLSLCYLISLNLTSNYVYT